MTESSLFKMKSKCNNVYSLLQVFQALLLYPCFMIRNPYHFNESSLSRLLGCKKDVFYRFMDNLYFQRWSLEVVFKEAKRLLGLGKCQANNFASQIAATSLTAL